MKNTKPDLRRRTGRCRVGEKRTRKTDNRTTFIMRRPAAAAQRRPRLRIKTTSAARPLVQASKVHEAPHEAPHAGSSKHASEQKLEGGKMKISKAVRDLRLADVKEGWRLAAIKEEPSSSEEV